MLPEKEVPSLKRIISLCCVALICVFTLAAPARAAEISNDMLLDVLEFNTDKIDVQTFTTSSPTITFTLPEKIPVRYVECLVIIGGTTPSGFTYHGDDDEAMTMTYLGNSMYRLYCDAKGSFNRVKISCNTTGSTRVTFEQVKIASRPWTHTDIESYCDIASVDYNSTIHYVPSDTTNGRNFDAQDVQYAESMFTATFYVNDWQKYDYIDFSASFEVLGINSITAYFGDTLLEVEHNQWSNGQLMQEYQITARVNLTGLDRTASYTPKVVITGQWYSGWVNRIDVLGTTGYVILNDYNFLYYYLGNIGNYIQTGFSNINSWITTQTIALQTAFVGQTSAIESFFTTNFGNLNNWIKTQTTALESAIRGDTSSGEDFQDDVQEELDELDQAQAVMDSVTKPAIEDIDVSVDQYVSQADIQVLATPMAVFFEGDLFSKVIIMSILLATVSYTLYGKK